MAIYTYPNPGGDFLVMLLKVEKAAGRLPDSFERIDDTVSFTYNPDIAAANRTALNNLMSGINVGVIPPNPGNTNYLFKDPLDWRVDLKTASGLDFMIYPITNSSNWSYEIQFDHTLSQSDKTKLRNAWASWITEKVY